MHPAAQLLGLRFAQSRDPDLPQLQIGGLRERDAEARIFARGKREVGQGAERRGAQGRMQSFRQSLIGGEVHAGETRPPCSSEQTAQCKEVIVLALVPHAVAAIAAHEPGVEVVQGRFLQLIGRGVGGVDVLCLQVIMEATQGGLIRRPSAG